MNTTSRYLLMFNISMFATIIKQINSEHLLPVFTGLWFDSFSYTSDGTDSCSMTVYKYDNLYFSPMEVLENFYSSDCLWDYTTFINDYNYTTQPRGFISPNTNDWKELMLDPNTAYEGMYRMQCTSKESGLKYTYSVVAVPYYDCPPNTRLSYDNFTLATGCTTLPMPCLADIVARDLNITGLTVLGHVGLVSSIKLKNPNIMQVLNNDEGIVFAPLYGNGSFSDIGKYWGERYGLQQQLISRLPMNTAVDIINAGSDQKHYHFNYTCSWDYYPGGTLEHPENCKFRCDSFVYYCYDTAGVKIQESFTYPTTLPYTIFHDFPCSANPTETCLILPEMVKTNTLTLSEEDDDMFCVSQAKAANIFSPTVDIFKRLRPILLTKIAQREQLPRFLEKYKEKASVSEIELLVRCICFELNRMSPENISDEVRPMLSDLFWQHKHLSEDNFALAILENQLEFYLKNPSCKWVNAFFIIKTTTQEDKERLIINYIDQQENIVEQANLVSASRLSHFRSLSQQKKCDYGKFFQKAYDNNSLSERDRNLLWLGLSEIKYPLHESIPPSYKC